MPQRLSDDDLMLTAAGFLYTGAVADVHTFRAAIVAQLRSEFTGHAATEKWLITFGEVAAGMEAIVLLPADAVSDEAIEHLAAIMADHDLLPLAGIELGDAIDRMKKRVNTIFRGDDTRLAREAAQWWAGRFSERLPAKPSGVAAIDAAAALIPHDPPSREQVNAFRESLERCIANQLESTGTSSVRMDYDPDDALATALEAAGIQPNNAVIYLPWKTTTYIRNGQFTTNSG